MQRKIFFLIFIMLLPVFVFAQKKGSVKSTLKGEIQLSGAFALYPMAVRWAEEFRKLHPGVKIDISAGGAGKGMTDALSGIVDIGMVSREIYDVEFKKGAFPIAVVKDAVIPTVNLNNPLYEQIKRTGIKKSVANRLWSDKIKYWGEIIGTNNRIPVHVYTRSDACGAAETWAAWFGMKQEDLEGTAVFGDPGVSSAIQRDKVGIGFNNIAYVYDQKSKKPFKGLAVMPIDTNNNGKIDPGEYFYDTVDELMDAIANGKYPSPPARNLFLVTGGKPTKRVLIEFLKYVLTDGQKWAAETGYVRLSEKECKEELKRLQ